MAAAATAQDPTPTDTAPVATDTATSTPTDTPTQTQTPAETPTQTQTSTPTDTPTQTATETATQTATQSPTQTATKSPTASPTHTATPHHADKGPTIKDLGSFQFMPGKHPGDRKKHKHDRKDAAHKGKHKKKHGGKDAGVAVPDWESLPASQVSTAALDGFRIPPFLLPIYQAAGVQYGVRWEVLAAINEVETDYGRNLNVSSAGALGWMQFMPASWKTWGVDANGDGVKDPFNPVDAIFAAARYLQAAGGDTDLRTAIFAYNHADWYVDDVLSRAREIAALPTPLVGALTGLAQGRFPVAAAARYPLHRKSTNGIRLITANDSRVVATTDGRITRIGNSAALGHFVVVADAYGNRYTYAHLGSVATSYPAPREGHLGGRRTRVAQGAPASLDGGPTGPTGSTGPTGATGTEAEVPAAPASVTTASAAAPMATPTPASSGTASATGMAAAANGTSGGAGTLGTAETPVATAAPATGRAAVAVAPVPHPSLVAKKRLFAHPARPSARRHGGLNQLAEQRYTPLPGSVLHFNHRRYQAKHLRVGSRVLAGTVLGRSTRDVLFQIQPAGKGAPYIDPKPILDGWRLLQSTALYHREATARRVASLGEVLLMSKTELQKQILADPRVSIYPCGRRDIRLGIIDRRVLATLEFLASSGLSPTVSALECGHSYLTASGNVSEHSAGSAVDIAAINGIPILGHQGPGSITEQTINQLLTLQGPLQPHQIISLMDYPNNATAFALPDHYNHIHVGFHPDATFRGGLNGAPTLSGGQWPRLVQRIGEIEQPDVATTPSKYAVRVRLKSRG